MNSNSFLKYVIIVCLWIISANMAFANPIDSDKAAMVAKNFMIKKFGDGFTVAEIVPETYHNTVVVYYVNFDEGGWVMVSANDLAVPVLAYSQYGKYDSFEMKPDNYVEFVSDYYERIKLLENETATNTYAQSLWKELSSFDSEKQLQKRSENNYIRLLGEPDSTRIAWGQDFNNDDGCEPSYNAFFPQASYNDCRCGKQEAGCGSVAMGQIMRYWNWPYTSSYRYYDWGKMPIKLYEGTAPDIGDEVGHLLKDCADASNMKYMFCEGSWTTVNEIEDAFEDSFRYKSVKKHVKSDWETDSWLDLIRSEIDAGRPVFYRGDKSDLSVNKHFFIIDGYDPDNPDMFSINFGWTGSCDNALYNLNAIANYNGTYNANQKALVGISPTFTSTTTITDVPYQSVSGIKQEEAQSSITLPCSGKVLDVNNGGTLIHVAGSSIVLKDGFHAKEGCFYRAFIDSRLSEVNDIQVLNAPNVITPNGDGYNDELQFEVRNANSWELIAYDRYGNVRDHSAGYFTGNLANVWDGGNLPDGTYFCDIRFKNNYGRFHENNNYMVYIKRTKNGTKDSIRNSFIQDTPFTNRYEERTELSVLLEEEEENVLVYPNPFYDILSVYLENPETNNEVFIYDFMGVLKYHKTNVGTRTDIHFDAPQGVYFMLIKTKHQSPIHKIIKL